MATPKTKSYIITTTDPKLLSNIKKMTEAKQVAVMEIKKQLKPPVTGDTALSPLY